ncbi:MAG: hypothetical protein ACYCXA_07905 [Actinomycetes bacterium]
MPRAAGSVVARVVQGLWQRWWPTRAPGRHARTTLVGAAGRPVRPAASPSPQRSVAPGVAAHRVVLVFVDGTTHLVPPSSSVRPALIDLADSLCVRQ